MDSTLKTTATICLLTVIIVSAQETCRNHSTCIKLEQCPSLQHLIFGGTEGYVLDILKRLTCGYEGVHSKVCCPPEVLQVKPQTVDSSLKLLPDTETCRGGSTCIKLEQCPSLQHLFRGSEGYVISALLNQLACGYEGVHPKVCCPPNNLRDRPQIVDSSSKLLPDTETCRGGSTCIKLEQCPNLRHSFGGSEGNVWDLLNGVTCGYEGLYPKVCCPPEILQVKPQTVDSSSKLLPDTSECGIQNNDRIVGDSLTELDEHPWLALLRYDKPIGWGFHCAGVLISPRYILTAAHCVKGADLPETWKLSQVRLGEYNITSKRDCVQDDCSPTPLDVRIEEIIPHEEYSKFDLHQQNDIALLRLARDVPYSDFIKPICLPLTQDQRNNLFAGYDMEVAGWGKTETRSMSEIKLKVRVPVVDKNTCSDVYSKAYRIITEKQMCAGGVKGEVSCRRDIGGPLMGQMTTAQNWLVVGVVSYGPTLCGTSNWPGVYTRVGAFVDWIISHIH